MTITFVSNLTHQDEEKLAAQLLKAADIFLSDAEFSYIINLETASGQRLSQRKLPDTEERVGATDEPASRPIESPSPLASVVQQWKRAFQISGIS